MKGKIAKIISIIGHPLFTIPLYILIVMFAFEDFKRAAFISLLIVGGIFIPLNVRLYIKSKNGSYTNFDVSDRSQRKSVFLFILPLMIAVTFLLYKTGQPQNVCMGVLFATILVFISQIVNFYIKSSLHVSLNIFLSFIILPVFFTLGIILLLFTGLIGYSRIVLGRHTRSEVFYGAAIGLIISLIMLYCEGFFKI
jgi:membrane-associated phospholipid phosphatase